MKTFFLLPLVGFVFISNCFANEIYCSFSIQYKGKGGTDAITRPKVVKMGAVAHDSSREGDIKEEIFISAEGEVIRNFKSRLLYSINEDTFYTLLSKSRERSEDPTTWDEILEKKKLEVKKWENGFLLQISRSSDQFEITQYQIRIQPSVSKESPPIPFLKEYEIGNAWAETSSKLVVSGTVYGEGMSSPSVFGLEPATLLSVTSYCQDTPIQ